MTSGDSTAPKPVEGPLTDPDALIGRVVSDRYRVTRVVARGGMGRIYLAEQAPLGRQVALKVLRAGDEEDTSFRERFLLEAATCAKLSHPNIVVVHDYGRIMGLSREAYFMAMEWVDGKTLTQALADEGAFEPARVVRLARDIARALRAAHRQGVIHRDLKPSNVMLARTGEGEHVKVLDFGIAKLARGHGGQELTREGTLLGSPKYMSPEQIEREPVDGRTDVYALGVIMFELLSGRVPFEGKEAMQTLLAHLSMPIPSLAHTDAPPELIAVVERCLQKTPADRYASADELLVALGQVYARLVPEDALRESGHSWSRRGITLPASALAQPSPPPALTPMAPLSTDARVSAARASGSTPRPTEDRTTTSSRGSTPTPAVDGSGTRNAMMALLVVFLVGTAAGVAWLARYTAGGQRTPQAAVEPAEQPTPAIPPVADPPEVPTAPPEPVVAADPPAERRFTLFVESQPTAATLLRGSEAIGVTPTYIELDAAELERAPITFRIEQRGRVPYTWTQGPSVDDVRVRVELVPDEPDRGRPRERRERTSTATVTTDAPTTPRPPPPPPSDDIRMQR